MKLTIDRFEGDFAVVELENGVMVNVPKVIIPSEAVEGDIIRITIDNETTKERKKHIEALAEDMWE